MINTKHVRGRRRLRFSDFGEILREVQALAERPTQPIGNWTLGQVCQHLGTAMELSVAGGVGFPVPWKTRLLARLARRRILATALPTGFRLPSDAAALLVPEPTSFEQGLAALERGMERLARPTRAIRTRCLAR